jgi:hypothetical protein
VSLFQWLWVALSENLRAFFHTHTKVDRYVWIAWIGVLLTWLAVLIAVAGSA